MRLSACLESLYEGRDFCEGMEEIAQSGISWVEFWGWWNKDLSVLSRQAERLNLRFSACCTRMFSLADAAEHRLFYEGLAESIQAVKPLGIRRLIAQAGADTGEAKERMLDTIAQGLRACVPLLEAEGVSLLLEPLNVKINHPGYSLPNARDGFAVVDAVGSPSVQLLYDLYHQQVTEGDILRTCLEHLPKIGHFHIAGHPGRGEWYEGELNYPYLVKRLEEAGSKALIGLEYFPQKAPLDGLRRAVRELGGTYEQ